MAFRDTQSTYRHQGVPGLGVGCVPVDRKQLWGSKKTTPAGERGGEQQPEKNMEGQTQLLFHDHLLGAAQDGSG